MSGIHSDLDILRRGVPRRYRLPMSQGFDNRISLQKLEIFCLVVELGGVSRAAEHLFVAQPVVTAHLRSLQDRLGAPLLYRDGRRMRLTEAGERAYAWATETLARTTELARELDGLSDGRRGSIVIGSSMSLGSYVLPLILTRFREARPMAEITLTVSDPEHAASAVETGLCDFAVIVTESVPPIATIDGEQVGYEDFVLVAAPDATPEAIAPKDLAALPLISSPRSHIRRALIDHQLEQLDVVADNVVIELGHPEAMKRAAKDGAGATFLFRSAVAEDLHSGSLREIAIEGVELAVPVFVLTRARKHLSPIQEELRMEIATKLRQQLRQEAPTPPKKRRPQPRTAVGAG
jgi:DNA-binding transcriptional LysR family regulator